LVNWHQLVNSLQSARRTVHVVAGRFKTDRARAQSPIQRTACQPAFLMRESQHLEFCAERFTGQSLREVKKLRGTVWDPFGYCAERHMDRALLDGYLALLETLLASLKPETVPEAAAIAALPMEIRGYGRVKEKAVEQYCKKPAPLPAACTGGRLQRRKIFPARLQAFGRHDAKYLSPETSEERRGRKADIPPRIDPYKAFIEC
jgi:hypothetical protein